MLIVQKGNKQLNVDEVQKEFYLALGYSVINEKGEVEEAGHATTLEDLKAENDTLKAELAKYQDAKEKLEDVASLEEEITTLKAENESLKAQLEAATKKGK
ncbi:hypothetical protein [Clostridium sp. 'White wine YQ']|uniref:hypothetical protein n=1 Tax=Clostridium sp. 'White wine YQ' TaxID=3027474 RepID=UPI00236627CA|nr:hypothetical protein [Clostridium sp. 'White wine YQ']MDD7793690.1 hypothetical protein [Clostridium sp. 'White wine YQ']